MVSEDYNLILRPVPAPYLPGMAPQTYYRRWAVWLEALHRRVLAATERAACLRAIQRFKISREDQRELRVCPAKG